MKASLREVVDSVFGYTIVGDYETAIRHFSVSYRALSITVPPKVHILERHVPQFMQRKRQQGYTTHGLGFWSEQAMESCHSDFGSAWEKRKYGQDHDDFIEKFYQFFLDYNSSHV